MNAHRQGNASTDSLGSSTQWIDDLPIPGPYTYNRPDVESQLTTKWVYEWIDPEFYNMLYHEWQGTTEWTHFTWQEYKAHLLRNVVLCNATYAPNVVVDDDIHIHNHNQAFYSQASWGRLEMKPHEPKK
jgi:hypothetical protein